MNNQQRPSPTRKAIAALALAALGLAACGGGEGPVEVAAAETTESAPGVRIISATEGAGIQTDPPADLVILDVRTPEEFQDGHLEGAVMLDFYEPDFAARLAELDPDVPYLLYCRSGNRSGQTAALMAGLGFDDVAEVDGGIIAWTGAGLTTVPG